MGQSLTEKANTMGNKKIYEIVAAKLLAAIESGNCSYEQLFSSFVGQYNFASGKRYQGNNIQILSFFQIIYDYKYPIWATFAQIKKLGGKVNKGATGAPVFYWNITEKEDPETGEIEKIPFLRYFTVFNISQTDLDAEAYASKILPQRSTGDWEAAGENIAISYILRENITFTDNIGGAYYDPERDVVNVPPKNQFETAAAYSRTLFHELAHSTGHKTRLNRNQRGFFGSEEYALEELVAECSAAYICNELGVEDTPQHAGYIKSWMRALKEAPKAFFKASKEAMKAADYILHGPEESGPDKSGKKKEKEEAPTPAPESVAPKPTKPAPKAAAVAAAEIESEISSYVVEWDVEPAKESEPISIEAAETEEEVVEAMVEEMREAGVLDENEQPKRKVVEAVEKKEEIEEEEKERKANGQNPYCRIEKSTRPDALIKEDKYFTPINPAFKSRGVVREFSVKLGETPDNLEKRKREVESWGRKVENWAKTKVSGVRCKVWGDWHTIGAGDKLPLEAWRENLLFAARLLKEAKASGKKTRLASAAKYFWQHVEQFNERVKHSEPARDLSAADWEAFVADTKQLIQDLAGLELLREVRVYDKSKK